AFGGAKVETLLFLALLLELLDKNYVTMTPCSREQKNNIVFVSLHYIMLQRLGVASLLVDPDGKRKAFRIAVHFVTDVQSDIAISHIAFAIFGPKISVLLAPKLVQDIKPAHCESRCA